MASPGDNIFNREPVAESGFLQLDDNTAGLGLTLKTALLNQFDIVQFAPWRRDTRASSRWFPPPCHRPASSSSSRPSNRIPASIRSGAIEEYPIRIC